MSYVLQIVGLAILAVGCGMAWLPLGVIVAGGGILVLGALMEAQSSTPEASPETN